MTASPLTSREAYWLEALQSTLSHSSLSMEGASDEEWNDMARSLAVSSENESLTWGTHDLTNPLAATVMALKQMARDAETAADTREDQYRRHIGGKLGVEPHRIHLTPAGHIEVSRT